MRRVTDTPRGEGRASQNGNTRVTGKEQYYTPSGVAEALTKTMLSIVKDSLGRVWLEPAAGTGSFVDAMRTQGIKNVEAYDIQPEAEGIVRADFLTLPLFFQDAVCLTNPPFGRNNSLSVPFFNHAATACDYIGFVVPRSWRKWSVVNRLDRSMHLVHDTDLSVSYVDKDGTLLSDSKVLNTVFQVWERRDTLRDLVVVEDRGYIERTTFDEANVSLTIFGRGCGTVKTEFPRKKNTTQMFLKAAPEVVEALKAVDLSKFYNQVAFVEALSIHEINYCLNEYFDAQA